MFLPEIPPSPRDFNRVEGDDHLALTCHIGNDPFMGCSYFVNVSLSEQEGGYIEYIFAIDCVYEGSDYRQHFLSGLDTKDLFDKETRRAILDVAIEATSALLALWSPEKVLRFTHDVDPPPLAMIKHHLISSAFIDAGYIVANAGLLYGKHVLVAERAR